MKRETFFKYVTCNFKIKYGCHRARVYINWDMYLYGAPFLYSSSNIRRIKAGG